MSRLSFRLMLVAATACSLAPAAALAQRAASTPSLEEASGPAPVPPPPPGFPQPFGSDIVVGGEVETHTQVDFFKATGQGTRVSAFNDTDFTAFANYKSWLSLNGEAKLERNRDDNNDSYFVDRNAAFRSEGLTLRQLYMTVRPIEGLSVYGGKIHPGFGSAYEQAPGQFYNFATDYEQDERIGFGVEYLVPLHGPELLGLSTVRLTAETFFLDTSVLSHSLLSTPSLWDPNGARPRRYTRWMYGPSNTGSFDSATFSIRGGKAERGLVWQLSYTQEATADPTGRTERGFSAGASYDPTGDGIPLGSRLGVVPFLEYAYFRNFAGVAGLERHYGIAGLQFIYARWNLNLAAGLRSSAGAATGIDHQENISVTYEIIPRLQAGLGFNFINVDGKSSRALSPALNYTRAF